MLNEGRLWNRDFILLNSVLFLISSTLAVFYQFHQYLETSGVDPQWFGLIIGADSISSFILLPALSPFLHAGNARRWMSAGALVMVAALLSYQAAESVPALIAVRIFHGTGFMLVIAALMAAVVCHIPHAKSGQAFGMISMNRLLPYAIIPPLLVSLSQRSISFLTVLDYCAALAGLVLVLLFFLKPPYENHDKIGASPRKLLRDAGENLKQRNVIILLFVNLLLYSSYTIVFFYLNQYGAHVGIENIGYFFTIATAVMILVRLAGGVLFDRLNKAYLVAGCMGILAVCYLALGQTSHAAAIYLIALFSGLGWGIAMPLLNAIMFDVSEPRFRAMNINLSVVMMQGGFFLGPLAGGLALEKAGYEILFYFCAVISLIAVGFALMIRKSDMAS